MMRFAPGSPAYLAVTGGATLLILAKPELVLAGFVLLVVPGLLLSVMPVAFGYGAAFALVRLALRRWLDRRQLDWARAPLNVAAALGALALGCAIPALAHIDAQARLDRLTLAPVRPDAKIAPMGDIRLELPGYQAGGCDTLCRDVLRLPSVRSVTVAALPADAAILREGRIDDAAPATTYRLRTPECRAESVMEDPEGQRRCLVALPRPPRSDLLVRAGDWIEWNGLSRVSLWALRRPVEIDLREVRRGGRVLGRIWRPHVRTLALPLRAWPMCGSTWETRLCWSNIYLGHIPQGNTPPLTDLLALPR